MLSLPDKQTLRRELRQRRDALANRSERSAAICTLVSTLALFQAAQVVHCYLPIRSEVDTRPLITTALAQGKGVVVPVVGANSLTLEHCWLTSLQPHDLELGIFGTPYPRQQQPVEPGAWQLIIVPMLGFDRSGHRLGYGKGYYDRLLASSPTPSIGVAFATQELAELPHAPHDIPLDWIVTENEIITRH